MDKVKQKFSFSKVISIWSIWINPKKNQKYNTDKVGDQKSVLAVAFTQIKIHLLIFRSLMKCIAKWKYIMKARLEMEAMVKLMLKIKILQLLIIDMKGI